MSSKLVLSADPRSILASIPPRLPVRFVDERLLMWLPCDELIGPTVHDLSGNGWDGVLKPSWPTNCPTPTLTAFSLTGLSKGRMLSFDKVDDYILVEKGRELDLADRPFTLMIRFLLKSYPPHMGDYRIFITKEGSFDLGIFLSSAGGTYVGFSFPGLARAGATWRPSLNELHHVAVRRRENLFEFFGDGVPIGGSTITYAVSSSTEPIYIGSGADLPAPGNRQHGALGDLRLYGEALSDVDIRDVAGV